MTTSTDYIIKRLEAMENEIAALKRLLQRQPDQAEFVTFEGIWEGAEVSEDDIEEAKRSVFRTALDDDI